MSLAGSGAGKKLEAIRIVDGGSGQGRRRGTVAGEAARVVGAHLSGESS